MRNSNPEITFVLPQNRVASLDILRGFALMGIAIVNILGFNASFFDFGGFYNALPDPAQLHFYQVLIGLSADKFIFLYSFLFGYGIWMQLQRFNLQGGNFPAFFSRRMAVLLAFGIAHVLFLWAGDILIPYAIAGMVVLFLRKLPVSRLLILGFFFYFFVVIWLILSVWFKLPNALSSTCPACLSQALDVYAHGDYFQILKLRLIEYAAFFPVNLLYYLPKIMGITLFGFVASKLQLHKNIITHRIRWLIITPLVAGLAIAAYLYYEELAITMTPAESPFLTASYMMSYELMNLVMALAYILIILLLSAFKVLQWILKPISYPGRMSLTNYLLQSVLFGFIFYGWGWGFFGWQNPSQIELFAIFVFILEIIISYLWLQKFNQGPLESIWRKLSYRSRSWKNHSDS
ncbi:MAG: DUF418 domain-containing protein [Bacteroidales bacterium]|nr:DUF418 domain-containing protein [Bacteroidales bacterium]